LFVHTFFTFSSVFFHQVLQQWEIAVKLILAREALIIKLEDFERLASDPNRFFEKGM
jgi:hypothetical protein